LYTHIEKRDFDLHRATQNNYSHKYVKLLGSSIAALIVSGCVSQQSALELNNASSTQVSQQNIALNGSNLAPAQDVNLQNSTIASNIPVKAPRPTTNVTQLATQQAQQIATQQVQQVTPQPQQVVAVANASPVTPNVTTPTVLPSAPSSATQVAVQQAKPTTALSIAEPSLAQPAGNVIAQAANAKTISSQQQVAVAKPVPRPAVATQASASQSSNSVEVASLSPTVGAASVVEAPQAAAVKKKSFFEKLFAPKESAPRPVKSVNAPKIKQPSTPASRIATASAVAAKPEVKAAKPKVTKPKKIVATARTTQSDTGSALPGVKSNSEIFGIKNEPAKPAKKTKKSGNTQVASAASLGRLSHKGLRLQHSKVQVACLKPGVLRILKMVERRYGKKPIITSGYRSPKGNRRAGGARNSQHIFCKAVDIQVPGVSKWKLAKYIRTLPGRGGVGTYCRTKSVHFDIGSKRDWHHPCRKSSKRKRKKA